MDEKFTLAQVFGGEYDGHDCCSCCNGYCCLESIEDIDNIPAPEMLYRITGTSGVDYISDRYVAIRADLVDVGEYGDRVMKAPKPADIGTIPDEEPAESAQLLRAAFVHHMKNCGIRIREGGGEGHPQHLYSANGVHVGWLMPVKTRRGPAITLDQVDRIKTYVAEQEINGWAIPVGSGDEWDVAAFIFNEAARIAGDPS